MARLVQTVQNKNKTVFDPSKLYNWDPADIFELTGQQLALLFHMLVREVNDPQGASVIMKYEAFKVVMSLMEMGVEQGVIKEIEPEGPITKVGDHGSQVKAMFDGEPVSQNGEKEKT